MKYKAALGKDPRLKAILKHDIVVPRLTASITMSLVDSILSQQLSVRVAQVMGQRFLELFGGKVPTARQILAMPNPKIRAIGISQRKADYIHNVARFIVEHRVTFGQLEKMGDLEIIEYLSQIKGVGRWTVEMLLIFGLGREDVFAVDDLGVQKGMIELFRLGGLGKRELRSKMLELSERWSPYRSYVCLHMWRYSGFKDLTGATEKS